MAFTLNHLKAYISASQMSLIMEEEFKVSKDLMKAVSAETRTQILKALENRQMTASELARHLGKHVTTVAEHLELLNEASLIERMERPGRKWIYYKLSSVGKQMLHPQPYKIILVLALSFLALGLGVFSLPVSYRQNFAMSIAEKASAPATQAIAASQPAAPNVDWTLPSILMAISVIGIVYSMTQMRKDYSSMRIPE